MKNIFISLVLFLSIKSNLHAQLLQDQDEKNFELPENTFTRIFWISLNKGNKIQIELSELAGLGYLKNLDSILDRFVNDIALLKDQSWDELASKRINYSVSSDGVATIHIRQYKPVSSSFVIIGGKAAVLKFQQDTLHIISKFTAAENDSKKIRDIFCRTSFFLNDINDIKDYQIMDLSEKIRNLQRNVITGWKQKKDGTFYLVTDPAITAKSKKGYLVHVNFVYPRISIDVQNYKNYFVPSITTGFGLIMLHNNVRRELGFYSESWFSFEKNNQDKVNTFRSTFFTVSYFQRMNTDKLPILWQNLYFSVSYLALTKGNLFEKNIFRIGAGRLLIAGGSARLEPIIYFKDKMEHLSVGFRFMKKF